jgi:hypothetical protein
MPGTGEAREVGADLGDQYLGSPPAEARNRLQPLHLWLKRAQAVPNLGAEALQTGVEEVDVGELLRDQEALMRAELPGEGRFELGDLLAQPPAGQLGERRCIGGSRDQRLQDGAAGLALIRS